MFGWLIVGVVIGRAGNTRRRMGDRWERWSPELSVCEVVQPILEFPNGQGLPIATCPKVARRHHLRPVVTDLRFNLEREVAT